MEIDPILKTKVIYYCEKVLNTKKKGDFLLWPAYSKIIGMSHNEVSDIAELLQKKKIFTWKFVIRTVPVIDPYGEKLVGLTEDMEDHDFIVNERLLKRYLNKLKQEFKEPSVKREELMRISTQIKTVFNRDKFVQVISNFHSSDEIYRYLEDKKYSLQDLLLYYSYSKETTLSSVLAEFLNPIYYDINSEKSPAELYDFINTVLAHKISDEEQLEWSEKILKYKDRHTKSEILKITYKSNLGELLFENINITVGLVGKEKDSMDCLVEYGKEQKVSWDEIYIKFDSKNQNDPEITIGKKSVKDTVSRINEKTKLHVEKNKPLVNCINNEYWLNYNVTKSD